MIVACLLRAEARENTQHARWHSRSTERGGVAGVRNMVAAECT